jgi:hypothetical protein
VNTLEKSLIGAIIVITVITAGLAFQPSDFKVSQTTMKYTAQIWDFDFGEFFNGVIESFITDDTGDAEEEENEGDESTCHYCDGPTCTEIDATPEECEEIGAFVDDSECDNTCEEEEEEECGDFPFCSSGGENCESGECEQNLEEGTCECAGIPGDACNQAKPNEFGACVNEDGENVIWDCEDGELCGYDPLLEFCRCVPETVSCDDAEIQVSLSDELVFYCSGPSGNSQEATCDNPDEYCEAIFVDENDVAPQFCACVEPEPIDPDDPPNPGEIQCYICVATDCVAIGVFVDDMDNDTCADYTDPFDPDLSYYDDSDCNNECSEEEEEENIEDTE